MADRHQCLEEPAAPIFGLASCTLNVVVVSPSTTIHSITFQKTVILIHITTRTFSLTKKDQHCDGTSLLPELIIEQDSEPVLSCSDIQNLFPKNPA
jgi:hypothetical protein